MSATYVAASIANFYGERQIEIHAWDENPERCDAMCRVLRIFLRVNRIPHIIYNRESKAAALQSAQGLVVCSEEPLDPVMARQMPVFDVPANRWWDPSSDQPQTLDGQKFQVLRWINKEEYPSVFLHQNRNSPLVQWLNQL
ncbi:MAG: hypothetical protein GC165_11855 [Armatimonadetes bacterium]|nr:hypothetical protein [Armatimonadota bacterium]